MNLSYEASRQIAKGWLDGAEIFNWLRDCVQIGDNRGVRWGALEGLSKWWWHNSETLELFKTAAQNDIDSAVREVSLRAIMALYFVWKDDPEMIVFFSGIVTTDIFEREYNLARNPRQSALEALLTYYPTHSKTHELLRDRATNDPGEQLRAWAQEQLEMQSVKLETEKEP